MPPHNTVTFNKPPAYPGYRTVGKDEHPLAFQLAQLRHAYAQLINGRVSERNMVSFADGLIAPAIRAIEAHIRKECTRVQESAD